MENVIRKVGDKVYVQTSYSFIPGTVVKVTPTGLVDVQYGMADKPKRFNVGGYEVASGGARTVWTPRHSMNVPLI